MRIYDGVEMHGRVVSTVVRGAVVYTDGVVTGRPGHGQFVRPETA
jgi:dihydroorotase-like cyclic amidohydrolase